MRGRFFTFEGGEGTGKSTQITYLKEYLKRNRYDYLVCREPGGTRAAEIIRATLLHTELQHLDPLSELFLFEAARADVTAKVIVPALDQGKVVISDRYTDSSLVYQGFARGIPLEAITYLNNLATRNLTPDLTILIDIDEAQEEEVLALARRQSKTQDRLESENLNFHRRVYSGYRQLAKQHPRRIKVIPYLPNKAEEMHKQILAFIDPLIS